MTDPASLTGDRSHRLRRWGLILAAAAIVLAACTSTESSATETTIGAQPATASDESEKAQTAEESGRVDSPTGDAFNESTDSSREWERNLDLALEFAPRLFALDDEIIATSGLQTWRYDGPGGWIEPDEPVPWLMESVPAGNADEVVFLDESRSPAPRWTSSEGWQSLNSDWSDVPPLSVGSGDADEDWLVYVGHFDDGSTAIVTSRDRGATWTAVPFESEVPDTDTAMSGVAVAQGVAVIGGYEYPSPWRSSIDQRPVVIVGDQSNNWHTVRLSEEPGDVLDIVHIPAIGWIAGGYQVIEDHARAAIWKSIDGEQWQRTWLNPDVTQTSRITDLTEGSGGAIAAGYYPGLFADPPPTVAIWTTSDGEKWDLNAQLSTGHVSDLVTTSDGTVALMIRTIDTSLPHRTDPATGAPLPSTTVWFSSAPAPAPRGQ